MFFLLDVPFDANTTTKLLRSEWHIPVELCLNKVMRAHFVKKGWRNVFFDCPGLVLRCYSSIALWMETGNIFGWSCLIIIVWFCFFTSVFNDLDSGICIGSLWNVTLNRHLQSSKLHIFRVIQDSQFIVFLLLFFICLYNTQSCACAYAFA